MRRKGELSPAAIDRGCDTVFACGGDGTVNNIAQVLATTPVALAVLPIGTANALAHDLALPLRISAAVSFDSPPERRAGSRRMLDIDFTASVWL